MRPGQSTRRLLARGIELASALAVFFLLPAPAQTQSMAPLDASGQHGAESALTYTSVFEHYRGYRDEEVVSWLEANATVGRIGGWRYYAEEAAQPDPPLHPPSHHAQPKRPSGQEPETGGQP